VTEKEAERAAIGTPNKLFGRYQEITLLLIGAGLTSLGGATGYYFQAQSWENQRRSELREVRRGEARGVFEEVSRLMDRRLYRMRRILWGMGSGQPRNEMQTRWASYREALFDWNDNLNRNLALIQWYFGNDMRERFERQISGGLRELGMRLEALGGDQAPDPQFLADVQRTADAVNSRIYIFDVDMISAILRPSTDH
jgi:hypothetical protein